MRSHDDPWRVSWDTIDARAWAALHHSATLPPSVSRGRPFNGYSRLVLWSDPSGMAYEVEPTSWSVYELYTATDAREPVVREAVWDRSTDLKRVQEAIGRSREAELVRPSIAVRDAAIDPERLVAFLNEATAFRIPVVWFKDTESVTSDASECGFEFFAHDQPPASVRLSWSFDTTPEWVPIIEWYWRLLGYLQSCIHPV